MANEGKKEKKQGFFASVVEEMHRVTWPTKKQLRKDTLVVIETSVIFALLLGFFDWGFNKGIAALMKIGK
ncbi:preprotein translocase subunit SecE [Enterococcus hirae]|jgi:preprotein translocase subunit SecE|nr:preprotein translocase subunit SecE [Enterococcus hirae]